MIILLAHATNDVRALYEQATGARVVPFTSPFAGMSAAYDALASSLGKPLLPRLLARLKVAAAEDEPIVFSWWSGGYAMARALAQDPESRARIAAWVGLDGIHASREADGTPSDAGVAWAVTIAKAARDGGAPVVLAHTDVRTYGTVTSTTDSTREVLRLLDIPPAEWPRTEGTPRPRVAARTWGRLMVAAYDTAAEDLKEHVAALRSWGPSLVADALTQIGEVVPPPAPIGPRTLRRGMSGEDVRELQRLLAAAGFVLARDGIYGPATESAVREYQEERGLVVDGIAGPATMASLRVKGPPDTLPAPPLGEATLALPGVLSDAEVDALFGPLAWVHAPTATEPGGVRITNGWTKDNLRRVVIQQLRGVVGAPQDGGVYLHRLIAEQTRALFAAWEAAGLLPLVRTWAGSWNPRLVRGGSTLSRHSYATSFDINAAWNGLGQAPAPRGAIGSVVDLVPLAVEHGYTWGGRWSRPDGMHFEAVEAL